MRWQEIDNENLAIKEAKDKGLKYKPAVLSNGDTLKELLVRCKYLLYKYEDDWTLNQKKRAELLFTKYPQLRVAYNLCISFRNIYKFRKDIVKQSTWLPFLTVCVCIFISVFYEFLEWFVAVFSGQSANAFLGTQGYVWDTQSDMLYATIGATCMVVLFAKLQDKQIKALK